MKGEDLNRHSKRSRGHLADPRPTEFRNRVGYADHVRNTVINYVSATEDDVAIRYLYARADVQQANLEHSYCHLPMLQHQVDRALAVTEQDAAKLEACTRAQSRSTVWH